MGLAESSSLLERIAAGDPQAARACIDKYGRLVLSIARQYVGVGEADDMCQEIFLELWRHADRYDPTLGGEVSFVATIARRRMIDRLRQRRRNVTTRDLDGVDVEGSGASAEDFVDGRIAARAMANLRPEQRQAIVFSAVEGMAHEEIAERMNLPLGTVKSHIRRGLNVIREALGDSGVQDE